MAKYQIAADLRAPLAPHIQIQKDAAAPPANHTVIGKFDHPDNVYPSSLVIAQAVQEAMYHKGFLDMQIVKTNVDANIVIGVTQIDLVRPSIELAGSDPLYDHFQLSARVWPPGASDLSVTYESLDPAVATVDSMGLVKAVNDGQTMIKVTANGSLSNPKLSKSVTCTVSGRPKIIVPVSGVTVAPTTSTKTDGQTQQLTPTVAPAGATNKAVTYVSATPAVATVNASGLVTAVSAGSAVITVKTVDGNKTATHTMTVT